MASYKEGAMVCYNVTKECQPQTRDDLVRLCRQHGIPESIIPEYAGDHAAVQRAISRVRSGWTRKGILLTPIESSKENLLVAIVDVQKDPDQERIDFNQCAVFRWNLAHDGGANVVGGHDIAQQVNREYQDFKEKIVGTDWSEMIVQYLLNVCQVERVVEAGYLYWCAPDNLPKVQQLAGFLSKIGVDMGIMAIEGGGTKTMVVNAVQGNLDQEITSLQAEVAAFSGEERPGTLRARLETYESLRRKITKYEAILGVTGDSIKKMADELQSQVEGLVTIADHKPDIKFLQALAAAGDDAIKQALDKGAIKLPKELPSSW